MFLGMTLYSHSASLHPGVSMGTGKLNARGNPVMDQHPIQGGVEILPVISCHRNQDNLQPDGPLGSFADFTFFFITQITQLDVVDNFHYFPLSSQEQKQ